MSTQRIGPYEILSALGAGGMGEVYRARDSKLNRDVALKMLPAAVAADQERLGRFVREAQVLASLNHPNIGAIHGFEDDGPVHALVLELVEGPTLAERIAKGPLPVDEATQIARQIADALEAAHEQGIVHRDLKPANIKLRPDGTVKVLDFGLAKALDTLSPAAADITHSPTIAPMTLQATILGTAAYMSPEQAKGKAVDRRADVWAFGIVFAEMLTGRPMFEGETVSEILAAVIMKSPDLSALPASTPAPLRQLITRCLDRDPKSRLRDIGEARVALEKYIADPVAGDVPATLAASSAQLDGTPVPLADAPDGRGLDWLGNNTLVFSPNASGGLFTVSSGGTPQALTKLDARAEERTHRWPVALPDGRTVLFVVGTFKSPDNYDESAVDAVAVSTGARTRVMDRAAFIRLVPGYLLFSRASVLSAVPFDAVTLKISGTAVQVQQGVNGDTTTGASDFVVGGDGTLAFVPGDSHAGLSHPVWTDRKGATESLGLADDIYYDPKISPDGGRVAFTIGHATRSSSDSDNIWIYDLTRKTLSRFTFSGGDTAVWSSDGSRLYYVSQNSAGTKSSIWVRPSDGSRDPVKLAEVNSRAFLHDDAAVRHARRTPADLPPWCPGGIVPGHLRSAIGQRDELRRRSKKGSFRAHRLCRQRQRVRADPPRAQLAR